MDVGVLSKKVDDLRDTIENERAEVRTVAGERDAAKRELHDVSKRTIELRKKLNGVENTERMVMEEIEKLRLHCKSVEAKDEEHLTTIDEMRRELDLVKSKLTESEEMTTNFESKTQEIVKEKEEIELEKDGLELMEEEKVKGESTILDLLSELGKLNVDLVRLEDKWRVEEEKSKQLITKVNQSSTALDRMKLEKENPDERMEAEKLRLELSGMEKRVEESERELKQMRREQEDQLQTQKKMESQVEVLEKDKGLAEKKPLEAHIIIDDLKEKIKSAGTNSEKALALVKKTVRLVCDSKKNEEEVEINGRKPEKEIIPFCYCI